MISTWGGGDCLLVAVQRLAMSALKDGDGCGRKNWLGSMGWHD